jgi:hypothetical protein
MTTRATAGLALFVACIAFTTCSDKAPTPPKGDHTEPANAGPPVQHPPLDADPCPPQCG